MNARGWLAVGGAVLVAAGGCRTLVRQAFANPVVEVKTVKVKGIGLQGGSLDIVLDVYNPNEFRLDATAISYEVWVDSSQLATGSIERMLTLSEKGRSEIVVPVEFTFAAVQRALTRFAARGSLDYRVTGDFTLVTPFGRITRPYSGTGRLDSFR